MKTHPSNQVNQKNTGKCNFIGLADSERTLIIMTKVYQFG